MYSAEHVVLSIPGRGSYGADGFDVDLTRTHLREGDDHIFRIHVVDQENQPVDLTSEAYASGTYPKVTYRLIEPPVREDYSLDYFDYRGHPSDGRIVFQKDESGSDVDVSDAINGIIDITLGTDGLVNSEYWHEITLTTTWGIRTYALSTFEVHETIA